MTTNIEIKALEITSFILSTNYMSYLVAKEFELSGQDLNDIQQYCIEEIRELETQQSKLSPQFQEVIKTIGATLKRMK